MLKMTNLALLVEAKDINGNTVRGTWDPYSDGSNLVLTEQMSL